MEKHDVPRLSYRFAHLHLPSLIFSLLIFLFSLPVPCSAFHLSSLTSKLPSTTLPGSMLIIVSCLLITGGELVALGEAAEDQVRHQKIPGDPW